MSRITILFPLLVTCASLLTAQQQPNVSASKLRSVVIGVALPQNQSKFSVTYKWARDQIIRNLKALRTAPKSSLTIETVPLESAMKNEALQEGADKHCDFVLLTKIESFSNTGGVFVGPEGIEPIPTLPGNADPRKEMAVDFSVVHPGHPNSIIDGRTASPTDSPSTTAPSGDSTFEDAASQIALRVATSLRKLKLQID
jgi:hypothetical protein